MICNSLKISIYDKKDQKIRGSLTPLMFEFFVEILIYYYIHGKIIS